MALRAGSRVLMLLLGTHTCIYIYIYIYTYIQHVHNTCTCRSQAGAMSLNMRFYCICACGEQADMMNLQLAPNWPIKCQFKFIDDPWLISPPRLSQHMSAWCLRWWCCCWWWCWFWWSWLRWRSTSSNQTLVDLSRILLYQTESD